MTQKSDALKKPKSTLESLMRDSQVITGKELIKRNEDKEKARALLDVAIEYEKRHRKPRQSK